MNGPGRVLVVNAGSSSLKLRLIGPDDRVLASRDLAAPKGASDTAEVEAALAAFETPDAVGHRIVHGGTRYREAVRLDAGVERGLRALVDLAPLHQPKSLAMLDVVGRILPDVAAVACFDTAFHATLPAAASTYALPSEWRRRWELRRYGFHGLSHAWVSQRVAELVGRPIGEIRTVSCHLGAGASLAAVSGGRSVDTTMGFTPLEGLVMATRSGSVDPGLVLWLEEHAGMPPAELASTLEHRSGLLGLAGTDDMRAILAGADAGEDAATLALGVYIHRLRAGIGAMAAAMGGLDAIAFTGGVGERAPAIRALAVRDLGFLGIGLDAAKNAVDGGDREIGSADAPVRALVVAAREDLQIAREVRAVLAG